MGAQPPFKAPLPGPTASEVQRERRWLREAVVGLSNAVILAAVIVGVAVIVNGMMQVHG